MKFERLENREMFCSNVLPVDATEVSKIGDFDGNGLDDALYRRGDRFFVQDAESTLELELPPPTASNVWSTEVFSLGDINWDNKVDLMVKYRGSFREMIPIGEHDLSIIDGNRRDRLITRNPKVIDSLIDPYKIWDFNGDGSADSLCEGGVEYGSESPKELPPNLTFSIENNFIYLDGQADDILGFDMYSLSGLALRNHSPLSEGAHLEHGARELIVRHVDEGVSINGRVNTNVEYTGAPEDLFIRWHHEPTQTSQMAEFTFAQNVETSPLLGDSNFDGNVDFEDFLGLSQHFGKTVADNVDAALCDFDTDGEIGFNDFLILSRNFNKSFDEFVGTWKINKGDLVTGEVEIRPDGTATALGGRNSTWVVDGDQILLNWEDVGKGRTTMVMRHDGQQYITYHVDSTGAQIDGTERVYSPA